MLASFGKLAGMDEGGAEAVENDRVVGFDRERVAKHRGCFRKLAHVG